jgi:hypothetical protein
VSARITGEPVPDSGVWSSAPRTGWLQSGTQKTDKTSEGAFNMECHPITAVVLSCGDCGVFRVADDYDSAQARGTAHVALTGHRRLRYSLVDAPDRITVAQACEAWSQKLVTVYADDALTTERPDSAADPALLIDSPDRPIVSSSLIETAVPVTGN